MTHINEILERSKLKALADDKINVTQKLIFVSSRPETLKHSGMSKTRCVCETLMPPKHPSFKKHNPDI